MDPLTKQSFLNLKSEQHIVQTTDRATNMAAHEAEKQKSFRNHQT